jgi:hypothetical protein
MRATDILQMLEHYYQTTLTAKQRSGLLGALGGDNSVAATELSSPSQLCFTPAQVEQLAAEYDELDDLVKELEHRSRSSVVDTHHQASLDRHSQHRSQRSITYGT